MPNLSGHLHQQGAHHLPFCEKPPQIIGGVNTRYKRSRRLPDQRVRNITEGICELFRKHGSERARLLHVKQESFEVLPFRMIDIDCVVGRLVKTVHYADAPAGLGGS